MKEVRLHRKLAAIVSADAVGYSRLMQQDEHAAIAQLDACREALRQEIEVQGGRVIDMAGDSALAIFDTATGAVKACLKAQARIAVLHGDRDEQSRMYFRLGVNIGETLEKEDGTVYGDGVNVAARIQALAEPGTVYVSEAVVMHARNKVDADFVSIGSHPVKNIAEPISVYRVQPSDRPHVIRHVSRTRPLKRTTLMLAIVCAVAAIGLSIWMVGPSMNAQFPWGGGSKDSVLALPKGPSIAVLPFSNLSANPQEDYFTDGITEEIITELTRFRDLFVIARNSTMRYKGKAVDVRDVGRDLGVRYVLEGSARRSGHTVRVTAQLLEATSGAHLWAETYSRDLTTADLFSIQDDITRQVVATVAQPYGVIQRSEASASKTKRPENLSAYECVLRYYAYEETLTPTEHLRMRTCLESAVRSDPLYVEAWALMSSIYRHEELFKFNPQMDAAPPLDRALTAAKRAVELDPRSELAHLFLATVHFQRREFEAFARESEAALTLSPNNSYLLAGVGMWSSFTGQWERGIALVRKAQKLNPYHPGWYHFPIAVNYFRVKEYDKAADEFHSINTPGWYQMYAGLAASYGQMGKAQEARTAAKNLLERKPDFLTDPRHFYRVRNLSPEIGERLMDGLRKAGLEIPPS